MTATRIRAGLPDVTIINGISSIWRSAARSPGFGILWEGAHGKEYKIQVSENGTDWTDVIHETNGSAGWKNYTLSNPAAGRYVRMLGIKRGNAKYGYSMYEFQVFGYQPQNPKPVTSIRLSQNTLSLLEGWSCALTATTQPSSNVYSLKWTSSDPAIVKVDNNGLVTAIGSSGTAMITVESVLDPTVKDTCEVTITPYAGQPDKGFQRQDRKRTDRPFEKGTGLVAGSECSACRCEQPKCQLEQQ